jgi:hypothetical protein
VALAHHSGGGAEASTTVAGGALTESTFAELAATLDEAWEWRQQTAGVRDSRTASVLLTPVLTRLGEAYLRLNEPGRALAVLTEARNECVVGSAGGAHAANQPFIFS